MGNHGPQAAVYTPTAWITGHDVGHGIHAQEISSQFHQVLQAMTHTSDAHGELAKHWDFQQKLTLPLAHILHRPTDLTQAYCKFICPSNDDTGESTFMARGKDETLDLAVQEHFHLSECYTRHLQDNGLYIAEEVSPHVLGMKELLRQFEETRNINRKSEEISRSKRSYRPPFALRSAIVLFSYSIDLWGRTVSSVV